MWKTGRESRVHKKSKQDQRQEFQIDRDRILYSSSLQRLGGITQVVRAGEVDVFHNRLTHTIKVAQIGRRIAQMLCEKQASEATFLGVDPEVVEAACLAHDLGHPPFGHVGEHALHEQVSKGGEFEGSHWEADNDGYEGNAQTIRIICSLAVRYQETPGLNLTAATILACLKYPWMRDPADSNKNKKWGYYSTERSDIEACMSFVTHPGIKTAEAEIMDFSDDIAYSVHDLEDFHRCDAMPWLRIFSLDLSEPPELAALIKNIEKKWIGKPSDSTDRLMKAHKRINGILAATQTLLIERYEGTHQQRATIRTVTSQLIGRYFSAIRLANQKEFENDGKTVVFHEHLIDEIRILKQITRDFIISKPSLAAQQRGQKKIISDLYREFAHDIASGAMRFIPKRHLYICEKVKQKHITVARAAADCVASLTESEAYAMHGRLSGYSSGSVLDPIVR